MYIPSSTFLEKYLHLLLSIFNTGVIVITFLTHEVFSISIMFVHFTLLGTHCKYNLSLLKYFPIPVEDLLIPLCKNDLSFKFHSAKRNCEPRIKCIQLVSFSFLIIFLLVSCFCPIISLFNNTDLFHRILFLLYII